MKLNLQNLKNRYWFFAVFLLMLSCISRKEFSPQVKADGIEIILPEELQQAKLEFSSMAWYKNDLLLVPQYPEKFGAAIYAISRNSVQAAISSGEKVQAYRIIKIENIEEVKKKAGATYEGFEAVAILGNRIYFTIELTELSTNCYVVGGTIQNNRIILDPRKMLILPKLKTFRNAGFESLVWSPQNKSLLAFFEYNKEDASPRALLVDTSLTIPVTRSIKVPALPFRLTDMMYLNKKGSGENFLGINYSFDGKKDYDEYIGKDSILPDEPSLQGKSLRYTSYIRLMRLNFHKDQAVAWKKVRDISFNRENWEGIAPFKNGVLMITDEHPRSILKWFPY